MGVGSARALVPEGGAGVTVLSDLPGSGAFAGGHLIPEWAWETEPLCVGVQPGHGACQHWAFRSLEVKRGPRAWGLFILEKRRLRGLHVTEKERE